MVNYIDLDFQGHVISYSSDFFSDKGGGDFEHNDFGIYASKVLRLFTSESPIRLHSIFKKN